MNGTHRANEFRPLWTEFVKNKPHWDLERSAAFFEQTLRDIEEIANRLADHP